MSVYIHINPHNPATLLYKRPIQTKDLQIMHSYMRYSVDLREMVNNHDGPFLICSQLFKAKHITSFSL